MTIRRLRNLDRTAPTFRDDLDALFTGGEFNNTIDDTNTALAGLTAMASGSTYSISYIVDSATADVDPGNGKLRFDNFAVQTSASVLRLDLVDSAGATQTTVLDAFDDSTSAVKGRIKIYKQADTTVWWSADLLATATPTGYRNLTLQNVAGSSAAPFALNDAVVLTFEAKGDKGDVGSLAAVYDAQSTNVQLVAADFASATRKYRDLTGTSAITQTIAALAGIANGDFCWLRNSTTVPCTIDPNGAETIDGAATIKIYPGESCMIVKEAAGFHTVGLAPKGGWVTVVSASASASSSLDFANVFSSDFDEYEIVGVKCKPSTNAEYRLRTSTDGGVTYDSASSSYSWNTTKVAGGTATSVSDTTGGTTSYIALTAAATVASTGHFNFRILVSKPSDADYMGVYWSACMVATTAVTHVTGAGTRLTAADVDSFRILQDTGTITSGTVYVRARKK